MRRLLLPAMLLLAGCGIVRPPVGEAEMLPVIIELHLADALSAQIRDTLHPNYEKNFDSLSVWTLRILDRNKISQEAFNKSMDWYRDHPDRLHKLYETAADSIERMRK